MARKAKAPEPLAEYVRKRDFSATPEPKGKKRSASTALRFVVQKHRASRLHYDFRLEAGGVLASWAVPKGPTLDTHERRLAMHVEDHPYDYRTFEGIIPKGNYGAGEVIVWDEGTYTLAEGDDPVAEIAAGKIKFNLHGKKLRGMFTLVKIKNKPGESGEPWLLIKDHDEFVQAGYDINKHGESAKTGKTIDDIAHNAKAKVWKSDRLAASATKRPAVTRAKADPFPRNINPMLATLIDAPFDDPEWVFEVKWDGFRAIAAIDADGTVTLTSRNGLDLLKRFKELGTIGSAFRSLPVLVDGEICALDEHGRSSFQALQQVDMNVRGKGRPPLTYVAFDLLYADGRDLRALPLEERKAKLEALIVPNRGVLYSKHIVGRGKAFFELAQREQLEGIIAKRRDAPYRMARSREWLKIKAKHEEEFVIGGWTDPKGSRSQFGALLLGYHEKGKLVFAGQVGTGFNQKLLRDIGAELRKRERKTSPFAALPRMNPPPHFVTPELVAQIAFAEWTGDGLLRQPVFLGLRTDKAAAEVTRERPQASPA
ncbi:MAG: non-homologous end-joining DNA ligase [Candidatus Lustribacter sp.]|jgi:bifunctional non-homologous end joining protein LigD